MKINKTLTDRLKSFGETIFGFTMSLTSIVLIVFLFIYLPIKTVPLFFKYFTEEREKPEIYYCNNTVYLMRYSNEDWYSYIDKSDECYECPSGATDFPFEIDGPFKTKEEGCSNY
jgi:hypothetical protein